MVLFWYFKCTLKYLLSPFFLRIVPYYLNEYVVYRQCVPCLRKYLFVFSDTCYHLIPLRRAFNFILICCIVQFGNWFKGFPLYSCYRFSNISLFSYPFSFSCALSREIIWVTCRSVAPFLISLTFFFVSINLFSLSSAVVNKALLRLICLINRLINVRLIRLHITFLFLYLRSWFKSLLMSLPCLYLGDHYISSL